MSLEECDSKWEPVRLMMEHAKPVSLGSLHTYQMRHTPRRVLYTMSYYKFACKLIGRDKSVLDVGCGEGLGTWMLAKECGGSHGIDFDEDLIATARGNWDGPNIAFGCDDFLDFSSGSFDGVVNFDVIEHIEGCHAGRFFRGMADCLGPYGIGVVGTPNLTAAKYASEVTNAGHINLYDAERLRSEMLEVFTQVLLFGANDEVVHTGFLPMCQYLIAVGIRKK